MPEFEVTFRASTLTPEQEDWVVDELDGFVGGHGEVVLITVSSVGDDGLRVAETLARRLANGGVSIVRVEPDLVSASTIARRANATRQAVSNWVRGERQVRLPFPRPAVLGGGQLWRWEEVNRWLRASGKDHDAIEYLDADQEILLNGWLLARRRTVARADASWRAVAAVDLSSAKTGGRVDAQYVSGRLDVSVEDLRLIFSRDRFEDAPGLRSSAWAQVREGRA